RRGRVIGHNFPDAAFALASLFRRPAGGHFAETVLAEFDRPGFLISGGHRGSHEAQERNHEDGTHRASPWGDCQPDTESPSGSKTVTGDPLRGVLPNVTRPPWASTTPRAMLKPKPLPPASRLRALSTR